MSKSKLDRLLDEYIGGSKGAWYYHIELGESVIEGGSFYWKEDCRRAIRNKVRAAATDDILIELLTLRQR